VASTSGSGTKHLDLTYTKTNTDPSTTFQVKLIWDASSGQYADNQQSPTKRFWWIVVDGVTYYWFDRKQGNSWYTDSSGTIL
jgi:hypothetical protein